MKLNLLKWCDEKITYLKGKGVKFKNGIPQLPEDYIYTGCPKALSTFSTRNDIPEMYRKESILVFYMYERNLWPRLSKIDKDIKIMEMFAGIGGFDLSPSINMLRPRQKMSILINAIYSCYCGTKGIHILPNFRAGDFGTIRTANYFPDNVNFIIGNLGCRKKGVKNYGEYILEIALLEKKIETLYVYGSISNKEAEYLIRTYGFVIVKFPDRRNRIRNGDVSYIYKMEAGRVIKKEYDDKTKRKETA